MSMAIRSEGLAELVFCPIFHTTNQMKSPVTSFFTATNIRIFFATIAAPLNNKHHNQLFQLLPTRPSSYLPNGRHVFPRLWCLPSRTPSSLHHPVHFVSGLRINTKMNSYELTLKFHSICNSCITRQNVWTPNPISAFLKNSPYCISSTFFDLQR